MAPQAGIINFGGLLVCPNYCHSIYNHYNWYPQPTSFNKVEQAERRHSQIEKQEKSVPELQKARGKKAPSRHCPNFMVNSFLTTEFMNCPISTWTPFETIENKKEVKGVSEMQKKENNNMWIPMDSSTEFHHSHPQLSPTTEKISAVTNKCSPSNEKAQAGHKNVVKDRQTEEDFQKIYDSRLVRSLRAISSSAVVREFEHEDMRKQVF
jgi:hypothetical protein